MMSCNFVQLSIKSICPHHYKGLPFERFYEAITALIRSVEILKRSRKKKNDCQYLPLDECA